VEWEGLGADRMSITYQVEKPSVVLPEMVPFFAAHWQEIAMNRDRVPLDVDYDKYLALGEAGRLHVVTVREDGKLVGYHVSFIEPHLHYKSTLFAHTDIYYLDPPKRKGSTGVKLFQFVEQSLKSIGVKVMTTSTKAHADISPIFERLGWTKRETVFTKYIGDK
jgi:GNAT superfamily N-acetyltransferase